MKVETTGNFMLIDILGGQEIEAEGVSTVKVTPFIQRALADGRLKAAGETTEQADAEATEPVTEPVTEQADAEATEPVTEPVIEKPNNDPPTSGRAAKKAKKAAG